MMGERHLPGPLQKRGWRVLSQTGAAVRVSWHALPCCRSQRSLLLQHSIGAPARAHIVPPSLPSRPARGRRPRPPLRRYPPPSCGACPDQPEPRRAAPCATWRRGAPAGRWARRSIRGAGWPAVRALGAPAGAFPRTQKVLWNSYPHLQCSFLAYGFLRLGCDTCKKEVLLAFSCKRRGFCPSCAGRHMAQTAAHLVERVIPWVPTLQWVVSVPVPLRYWMSASRDLTAQVHTIIRTTI